MTGREFKYHRRAKIAKVFNTKLDIKNTLPDVIARWYRWYKMGLLV